MAILSVPKRVRLPPSSIALLDQDTFLAFCRWNGKKSLLEGALGSVKSAVLKESKYSKHDIPDQKQIENVESASAAAIITTTPTGKYADNCDAYEKFEHDLRFLAEQREREITRRDIRMIDGEIYIEASDAHAMFSGHLGQNAVPKQANGDKKDPEQEKKEDTPIFTGVRQVVTFIKPEPILAVTPQELHVEMDGRAYSVVSESTLIFGCQATNLLAEGKKRADRFRSVVLDDALKLFKITPPEPVVVSYPFGHYSFDAKLEPRKSPSYKDMVAAFLKNMPEDVRENSKIGDLTILMNWGNAELIALLKEKGIVNAEFEQDYNPRLVENGKVFIRLQGLKDRAAKYREKHTEGSLELNILTDYDSLYGPWLNESVAAAE